MGYLETPSELFWLLKTQTVPVTGVQVGDIVLDGHSVVQVTEIKRQEPPDGAPPDIVERFTFIELARKELTGPDEGYIRAVTRRVTDEVEIVDRSCLR